MIRVRQVLSVNPPTKVGIYFLRMSALFPLLSTHKLPMMFFKAVRPQNWERGAMHQLGGSIGDVCLVGHSHEGGNLEAKYLC